VLSGRGLCDEPITRPEESYRLWCVVVCDLETSRMRRPWSALGSSATGGRVGRLASCYSHFVPGRVVGPHSRSGESLHFSRIQPRYYFPCLVTLLTAIVARTELLS